MLHRFVWLLGACLTSATIVQAQVKPAANYSKRISYQNGILTFTPYASNIVKITYKKAGDTLSENISDAVIAQPAKAAFNYAVAGDTVMIGNVVLLGTHQTEEGYKGFQFLLSANEMLFGGGERAIPLNRRGYKLNLYNNPWYGYAEGADNLNYSVPFFSSSNGYGLFFDNPAKAYVDLGKTQSNVLEYGTQSGELNVFVILGKDYSSLLQSYHQLTGTQPLPPRWALGNFMSRFGYTSQQQVTDIARTMEEEKMPFDAVIFDLFWFGDSIKGTLGNLDWVNKKKWPQPQTMVQQWKQKNIQTILITEPFVLKSTPNYASGKQFTAVDSNRKPYELTDFYFGNGGLIDIFRKDAQDWFWQFYQKQMHLGVEGWWGDLGEPEKHPDNLYHSLPNRGNGRLFAANEVHNLYGHTWTKMLFEKYAQYYPSKRLFSLNRSGFAGSQRYSIFPWSGDVSRSWSGLKAQLPVMLGMSMSGVPYVHADAGGFAGGEGDAELYLRWLQFAAYTPIFRPHGTALYQVDTAAFSYPSEPALQQQPYKDLVRKAVLKRYEMLPYNYTLAYRQAQFGEPLVRPLYYQFPNDTKAMQVQDQFMWGDAILVAPVLQKEAPHRKIYLPEGEWYSNNFNKVNGGREVYLKTTLADIPVYYRAGAIVPLEDMRIGKIATTADFKNDSLLIIHYFASEKPSEYTLYEDDGSSKNAIETHRYELITIKASPSETGYKWTLSSNGGSYAGKPAVRRIKMVVHQNKIAPKSLVIDGVMQGLGNLGNNDFSFDINFTGRTAEISVD